MAKQLRYSQHRTTGRRDLARQLTALSYRLKTGYKRPEKQFCLGGVCEIFRFSFEAGTVFKLYDYERILMSAISNH